MLPAKRLVTVLAVGTLLCACGSTVKPPGGRGQVDNPATQNPDRLACLRSAHLPVSVTNPIELQIGSPPSAATVRFAPSPGAAQALQIEGTRSDQGAEVIGAALLFPNHAPSHQLDQIENCLSQGVQEPQSGY